MQVLNLNFSDFTTRNMDIKAITLPERQVKCCVYRGVDKNDGKKLKHIWARIEPMDEIGYGGKAMYVLVASDWCIANGLEPQPALNLKEAKDEMERWKLYLQKNNPTVFLRFDYLPMKPQKKEENEEDANGEKRSNSADSSTENSNKRQKI